MSVAVTYLTPGLHGYSAKFSPFLGHRLACVCCQQYGISGSGTVLFFDCTPAGLIPIKSFNWTDGLFDVTWSESNDNIAVTAGGDGCLHVWDVNKPQDAGPVHVMKGHTKEWNVGDGRCLNTYTGHEHIVYSAMWSPLVPKCFASVSGDRTLRVWDVRKPYMSAIVVSGHTGEILSCDWSKYDQNVIVSAATDGSIKVWDLRNPQQFLHQLNGHQYAVRRVKFSPFDGSVLLSCSYDFTVRTWNTAVQLTPLETIQHHTEFVYGIDFNLHIPGQIVDCSWDESIKVYGPPSVQPMPR